MAPPPVSQAARELLRDSATVDLHVDSLLWASRLGLDLLRRRRALPLGPPYFHADLPRLVETGFSAVGFGVVTNPLATPERRLQEARRQADLARRAAKDSAGRFLLLGGGEPLPAAPRPGRLCGFLGLEGAHMVEDDLGRLVRWRDAGARYITLAHFSSNRFATCAHGLGANPARGLTAEGADLVREMNRLGLAADLAHVNERTFFEAARVSQAPVIVTHAGVRGVFNHWRNLSDEQLRAVADSGGVTGIFLVPAFLAGRWFIGVEPVLDHIVYALRVAGAESVALGSDWDGAGPAMPRGLGDCEGLPLLVDGLLRRRLPESVILRFLGANALRALADIARRAEAAAPPAEKAGDPPTGGRGRLVQ